MSESLRTLKGVGEKTEKLFAKIGVTDVEDLIHYYPRTYDAYEEPVEIQTLEEGTVASCFCDDHHRGLCKPCKKSAGDHNHSSRSYRKASGYLV